MLCALLLTGLLCFAPSPQPKLAVRLLAMLAATALAWHPVYTIVFRRGRSAVRRAYWRADGSWLIATGEGSWAAARLHPATAAFGPWILLVWSVVAGRPRARRYALIDAAVVSVTSFRALRGRLNLTANRANPRNRDDNC